MFAQEVRTEMESSMNQSRILPFYMTYPLPLYYQEEDTVTRDLEYLQQMYPLEAKRYQKIIAETLDRLDYEGSMIYDEYPDRWQIYRLTQIIVDKMRKMEDDTAAAPEDNKAAGKDGMGKTQEINAEFVQVLLCYEIYRKRHSNRNGILKF